MVLDGRALRHSAQLTSCWLRRSEFQPGGMDAYLGGPCPFAASPKSRPSGAGRAISGPTRSDEVLGPQLVGEDPTRVEFLREKMYSASRLPLALAYGRPYLAPA